MEIKNLKTPRLQHIRTVPVHQGWFQRVAASVHDLVVSMLEYHERLLLVECCCRDWYARSRLGRGWTDTSYPSFYGIERGLFFSRRSCDIGFAQRLYALETLFIGKHGGYFDDLPLRGNVVSVLVRLLSLTLRECNVQHDLLYHIAPTLRKLEIVDCRTPTLSRRAKTKFVDFSKTMYRTNAFKTLMTPGATAAAMVPTTPPQRQWPFATTLDSLHCSPEAVSKQLCSSLSNLRLLSLVAFDQTTLFDPRILTPLAGTLTDLRLQHCTSYFDREFTGLARLTSLTSLQLLHSLGYSIDIPVDLGCLSGLKNLHTLVLQSYHENIWVEPLSDISSLRRLYLLNPVTVETISQASESINTTVRLEYSSRLSDLVKTQSFFANRPTVTHEIFCDYRRFRGDFHLSASLCDCNLPPIV